MPLMDSEDEPTNHRPKLLIASLVLLALYLIAYFPAFSYMVRHPEHQRFTAIFRPIPNELRHAMFQLWAKLDPDGFRIVDQQAAAHPEDPAATAELAAPARQ